MTELTVRCRHRVGSLRNSVIAWRFPSINLGLRARVTLGFGLLALALSTLIAVLVGVLVSQYLVGRNHDSAIDQTAATASSIERSLTAAPTDIPELLDAAPPNSRVASLLHFEGSWYSTSITSGPSTLPSDLIATVEGGTSATQRVAIDGQPYLVVGTPLGTTGASYFELYQLAELDRTFHVLSIALVLASILATGLGLVVGRVASGRVLRPLVALTNTAAAVAEGDLDTRLEAEDDPDVGELARSFNQTTSELKRRVIADARFAGDVSHELRTPLTTMLNSMAVLQNRRADLPDELLEPFDLLGDELERFRQLVVDLIQISRDEEDVDSALLEPVVVADLVRVAVGQTMSRDLTRVEPSAAQTRMLADKRRLERVVVDLVENAERHGGGCTGVTVRSAGACIEIVVDDCGPGVAVERRERIFERFARDGSTPSRDGVGLGLAIVTRHVRWHGGRIAVTDRPGGGARFVVSLPIRKG